MPDDEEMANALAPRRAAESRDPSTGEVWASFAAASSTDVLAATARARRAQGAWSARPLEERLTVLARFGRALFERRADVARVISRETGKPLAEAFATEIATTLDIARFYVRSAPQVLAPERMRSSTLALWRKRITVSRDPLGVLGVISPWNYPFMLPAGILAPALVAGNAVVLKPSELTPSSAALLAELLSEAGLPEGVLHVVHGDGATGRALVESDVDKIFFTGSVATGRRVAHACADRLIPCALELGGSDPALVLDDADVEHAASGILWGRFSNAGQTCVAPKRVFVDAAVHDRFVDAMERRVRALRTRAGDLSYDMATLIRPHQGDALAEQRDDAVARGAIAVTGDTPAPLDRDMAPGDFAPTLLIGVPPDARVLHEETFGPLLPIVQMHDTEAMIAAANESEFGLSASIWTGDRARGHAVARRLHAGTVVINDVALIAGVAEVPHGGVKRSGTGRAHGVAGLEECVRTHTVVDDVMPAWRQPWWFGYGPRGRERFDAYVRLAHGRSLWERVSGLRGTLALLFRPERPL